MDMQIIFIIIAGIGGIFLGFIITSNLLKKNIEKKNATIIKEAEEKGEVIKKEKILQAKEKFLQLKSEHDKIIQDKNANMHTNENRLKQKEASFSQRQEDFQRRQKEVDTIRNNLNAQLELVSKKQEDLEKSHKRQVEALETISSLSATEAKAELIETLKDEAKSEAVVHISEIVDEAKLTANREAKKIVIETIQRTAAENAIENSVSVFNIESDEIKGRIIGREGRNIRTLEAITGVEIIIDDSPDAILLSSFDPVRREIAKQALHKLVTDGRIHPARIEEIVNKRARLQRLPANELVILTPLQKAVSI